jgi:flagellar hook protein FlgE
MELTGIALEGLRQAETKLDSVARRTATSEPEDSVELSRNAVELIEAKNAYAANLKLIHAAEDLEKRLLDILG